MTEGKSYFDRQILLNLDRLAGRPVRYLDGKKVFVISGPSGAGKGTFIRKLRDEWCDYVYFSVSCTTRGKRPGEVPGEDYQFISQDEFELRRKSTLLEYAQVHGNGYGTPREPIEKALAAGLFVIIDADINGVRQLKMKLPDACYTFLTADQDELRRRLVARGGMNKQDLELRLSNAEDEVRIAQELFKPHEIISTVIKSGHNEERTKQYVYALIKERLDCHAGEHWVPKSAGAAA